MNDVEYKDTQATLITTAKNFDGLDFDGFIERISQAESLAPVVDPTMYRRAADILTKVKELAIAARSVQQKLEELRQVKLEQMAREAY